MRNKNEKTIDGVTIMVTQLPAMKAMRFFREVVDTFGPALTSLGDLSDLDNTELSVFKPVIENLMANMSEDKLEDMTRVLLGDCLVLYEGKFLNLFGNAGIFDMVFQGKVFTVFKFLRYALEVNYGDFIEGFASSSPLAALGSQSESQKE